MQIALLVTENKIEYNKVMEYLLAHVAYLEDSMLTSVSVRIKFAAFNCSSGLVDFGRESEKRFAEKQTEYFLIFHNQEPLDLNTQFEWLFSFEDYWRNTYPDISCTASVSPGGFVQTLTFDLAQLKNEPSLKELLNTREKERELKKQKELFAQKVAERERQAWLKQRNREYRLEYLINILVPVLYLAFQWIPIIPAWYTQPWIPQYVPPYLSCFLIFSAVLVNVLLCLIRDEFGCGSGFIVVLMLAIIIPIIPIIVTQSMAALFLCSIILDVWLLIEWIVYRVNC